MTTNRGEKGQRKHTGARSCCCCCCCLFLVVVRVGVAPISRWRCIRRRFDETNRGFTTRTDAR